MIFCLWELKDILRILITSLSVVADNAEQPLELCNKDLPDLALLDIQIAETLMAWSGQEIIRGISSTFHFSIFTNSLRRTIDRARARTKVLSDLLSEKPLWYKREGQCGDSKSQSVFWPIKKPQRKAGVQHVPKIVEQQPFSKIDSKLIKVKIEDLSLRRKQKADYALFKTNRKRLIGPYYD